MHVAIPVPHVYAFMEWTRAISLLLHLYGKLISSCEYNLGLVHTSIHNLLFCYTEIFSTIYYKNYSRKQRLYHNLKTSGHVVDNFFYTKI